MAVKSYLTVTEIPDDGASPEQMSMLYTRYHLAGTLSRGRDVLEVACGAGLGLGYLARRARKVVAGDYDEALLRRSRAHYLGRVRLLRLDAHSLPFASQSFDVVVLFEALYYLTDPARFIDEARRVLRPCGVLVLCSANRERPGFNPSPFAVRYFSLRELHELLAARGFETETYGGFPEEVSMLRGRAIVLARKIAVCCHLIPSTMRGKAVLKRLLHGKIAVIPPEVQDEMSVLGELTPLAPDARAAAFKVLYAVARVS